MGNGNGKNAQKLAAKQATAPRNGGGGGGGGGAQKSIMNSTQKMKTTIDNLEKRRKFLETRSKQFTTEALKYKKAGNIQRAKMALKKRKQVDGFVNKIDAQIFTLQEQQLNLEQASVTNEIIAARVSAVNAQKKLNKQLNIEQVEDLVADTEEMNDDLEQINEILAPPEFDDPELDAMLADLGTDDFEKEIFEEPKTVTTPALDLPAAPMSLPAVPTGPVKDNDQKQLEALAAEMI